MKMPGRTLLSKVFLVHAAVLCIAAIFLPLTIDALLRERVTYFEHKVLKDRATLIAEALLIAPDDTVQLAPGRFSREGDTGEFGYVVVDKPGTVHVASSDFAKSLLGALSREDGVVFSSVARDDVHYDTISWPLTIDGRQLWVVLGWNTSEQEVIFDDVAQGFLWNALAVTVLLLGLLLLVDTLIIRRFFRPVLRVSQQVQELDIASADARLPAKDLPQEILPLAHAFNAALERVEQSYKLQKEFTADAAHELRTPLAVLDARLQTLPQSDTRETLLADARLMARIVSQLLEMAALDQMAESTEETDLLAVSQNVVAALAPEAIIKGQTLGLTEPEGMSSLPVLAREQDVWHMLRNLVENAIRHTPPGTSIDVVLGADGSLTVQDDGPGIPKDLHEHIFKRFWRRKRSGGSGAGLGMAIVQRVAQSNGGSITLRSDEGHGTAFIIHLPRPPQPATPAAPKP